MKLLLDTHVWLWSMLEPARLRPAMIRALRAPDARLWLSPVSVWETVVLLRKGRISLSQDLGHLVGDLVSSGRMQIAPVTVEVALEVARLRLNHRDPADNLLAATARVYGLVLATADKRLLAAPGLECMRG